MSDQTKSPHYYTSGAMIQHIDGRAGFVEDADVRNVDVLWDNGTRSTIEQFSPEARVVDREVYDVVKAKEDLEQEIAEATEALEEARGKVRALEGELGEAECEEESTERWLRGLEAEYQTIGLDVPVFVREAMLEALGGLV